MVKHTWHLNNEVLSIDENLPFPNLVWDGNRFFSFELYGKRFNAEVMKSNLDLGSITLKINHRIFEITRKRPINEIISQLGLDKMAEKKLLLVKSPMPGKVLEIKIQVGQLIVTGDALLTLEAMKMENVLKAEGTGKVKQIVVAVNDTVEKDTILIEFE
jgi:biotin carboxyl carrier protein